MIKYNRGKSRRSKSRKILRGGNVNSGLTISVMALLLLLIYNIDRIPPGKEPTPNEIGFIVDLDKVENDDGILYYEEIENKFKHMRSISSGTYGEVFHYETPKGETLAIKVFKKNDKESIIVEKLQENDINICNTINALSIENFTLLKDGDKVSAGPGKNVIIMNLAEGELGVLYDYLLDKYHYNNKIYINEMKEICKQLVDICKCLYDQDIYYADFKSGNTFYKLDDNGDRYKILLGDLGGLCGSKIGNDSTVSTYPYKGNKKKYNKIDCNVKNDMEKTMIHGISVILIQGLSKLNPSLNDFLKEFTVFDSGPSDWGDELDKLRYNLSIDNLEDDFKNIIIDMYEGKTTFDKLKKLFP